jgi:hypothetical protein
VQHLRGRCRARSTASGRDGEPALADFGKREHGFAIDEMALPATSAILPREDTVSSALDPVEEADLLGDVLVEFLRRGSCC